MIKYDYSVAIIATTDIEDQARRDMYDHWKPIEIPGDAQQYYEADFLREGRLHKVVAAQQDEMGMTAGAVLSMKMMQHFRPQYLIMVGIAAGVALEYQEEQIYGDVVVADMIWNYSAGKFVTPDNTDIRFGEVGFEPRPTVIQVLDEVRSYVQQAIASDHNQCHVYIGPMASGSAVVANHIVLEKQIRSQFQHTAGLDMEAYAIAYAAHHAVEPRPYPLVVKSVCDYADSRKSDQYQKFAAYTSVEFTKLLIEQYLPYEDLD